MVLLLFNSQRNARLTPDWTWLKVSSKYCTSAIRKRCICLLKELINSEDKFTEVRTALKGLVKLDFDKLIVSVSCSILKQLADIPAKYSSRPQECERQTLQSQRRNMSHKCSIYET